METIAVYKNVPITVDPVSATVFAIIGWVVVLSMLFYALYRWYKKPMEVAKKS